MRTFATLLLTLSMSLGTGMVEAANDVSQVPAPPTPVGIWTSHAGESKDQFVLRVASAVYPTTRETGFEVCGNLMVSADGQTWRLPMVTDGSHVGCRTPQLGQAGFVLSGETLHTHPHEASFHPNVQDMALFPTYRANPGFRYPVDGDMFSPRDMANGPGYVVASGQHPFGSAHLLYQQGPGTVRELGRLIKSKATLAADADSDRLGAELAARPQATTTLSVASP